jgi:hypothetical protein
VFDRRARSAVEAIYSGFRRNVQTPFGYDLCLEASFAGFVS